MALLAGVIDFDESGSLRTAVAENGVAVAYQSKTLFVIEVGRGTGSYRVEKCVVGSLYRAMLWYRGINVGLGYKKRLRMLCGRSERTLLRQFS